VLKKKLFRTGSWLRGKAALGAGAAAAAAIGLAAFGPASTADASALPVPSWHLTYDAHAPALDSVAALSKDNAWAAGTTGSGTGQRPQFMHWNGKSWAVYNISNITKFSPVTVAASAANNVWTFGWNDGNVLTNPYAIIYHGSNEVSSLKLPASFDPSEVAVLSPTSVWGVATQGCGTGGNDECLEHWNGTGWSATDVPGRVISATSVGGHAFFLVLTNVKQGSYPFGIPKIYEPTSKMNITPGPNLQISAWAPSLVVELNGQRYLEARLTYGSAEHLWHWNGSTWTAMSIPKNVCPAGIGGSCPLTITPGIVYDNSHGFWSGYTAHWTGTAWVNADFFGSSMATTAESFGGVAAIPGTGDVWGVGAISPSSATNYHTMVAVYPALP
jgi:hypothetical protein